MPAKYNRLSTLYFFWLPGLIGVLAVGVLIRFHLTAKIPFVSQLVSKTGPPGFIGILVLAVTFWTLIALLFRRLINKREKKVVKKAKLALSSFYQGSDLDYFLESRIGQHYTTSLLRQRFLLLKERLQDHNCSERAESLMAGQSGVDAAHTQRAYGPMRALVWALPALGFMGTAFEMANAVGGLGYALGKTTDYNDLRNLLVNEVVPHLAGAFDITLFALGSSVICFLLLSLVVTHEEDVLNEADSASLQALSRIKDDAGGLGSISGQLQRLIERLEQIDNSIGRLDYSITALLEAGGFDQIIPLLKSMGSDVTQVGATLLDVQANLEQERIITVRPGSKNAIGAGGRR